MQAILLVIERRSRLCQANEKRGHKNLYYPSIQKLNKTIAEIEHFH